MTIHEKLGITIDTPHREKYGAVVKLIGLDNFVRILPFSIETLANKLKKDSNLNNIPLKEWDRIAGFSSYITKTGEQKYISHDSELKRLLQSHGITCYSPAELTCILKEAATELVEEYTKETLEPER